MTTPSQAGSPALARAAEQYEAAGYEVLERSWRRREGEVDLIVRDGRTVVFCLVVARPDEVYAEGADAADVALHRRIRRLADRWLTELTPAVGRDRITLRMDVARVHGGSVEVFEDAF